MTDTPDPDEAPAVAALLDEAAELATVANEKLAKALAIAEQQRRDATFNADRQWFKSRPDRSFRARLATAQEVEDLHSSGAWPPGWVADESCFVCAVVKHEPPAGSKCSTLSCRRRSAIMHLTDGARYAIVMVKEIDHDPRRVKQRNLS